MRAASDWPYRIDAVFGHAERAQLTHSGLCMPAIRVALDNARPNGKSRLRYSPIVRVVLAKLPARPVMLS